MKCDICNKKYDDKRLLNICVKCWNDIVIFDKDKIKEENK